MYVLLTCKNEIGQLNQRTNGPVNAHLISWPSKAQNIQNHEDAELRVLLGLSHLDASIYEN